MAQSASLAEAKAQLARKNLENYVFGTAVSTVPPVVPPMLPRGAATFPAYPYANSPTQWPVGTPPIAVASMGVDMVAATTIAFNGTGGHKIRYSDIHNFL